MRRVVAVEDDKRVAADVDEKQSLYHLFATWRNPVMIPDHNNEKIYDNSIIIINISSTTVLHQYVNLGDFLQILLDGPQTRLSGFDCSFSFATLFALVTPLLFGPSSSMSTSCRGEDTPGSRVGARTHRGFRIGAV